MSKHETPLTRRFWDEVGGTLIEEFPAVQKSAVTIRKIYEKLKLHE